MRLPLVFIGGKRFRIIGIHAADRVGVARRRVGRFVVATFPMFHVHMLFPPSKLTGRARYPHAEWILSAKILIGAGSKGVPAPRASSSRAAASGNAFRYGRSVVKASKTST